ncbi:hypothetical protein EVAR_22983_1 [Eumeta japonica]|uniref:Uncharacterized protein n=1 Tax=Eumeta variegata TaxID=151549 RepID=A0A4C1UQM0_EUMVA|nr:hypothetical protein EVAR_22983_1 [Eumeta japonica]
MAPLLLPERVYGQARVLWPIKQLRTSPTFMGGGAHDGSEALRYRDAITDTHSKEIYGALRDVGIEAVRTMVVSFSSLWSKFHAASPPAARAARRPRPAPLPYGAGRAIPLVHHI